MSLDLLVLDVTRASDNQTRKVRIRIEETAIRALLNVD